MGSSNWKRVMIKLTDDRFNDVRNVLSIRKPRKLEHYNLRYLTDYPWQQRLEMLQNYYMSSAPMQIFRNFEIHT